MKQRVRVLLRVSSNQQLELDGDLSIQRQLVHEYVEKQENWNLDQKEYFEGSNSGYKNLVKDRDILQEILKDAKNGEFDILVAYKDDRIGRLLWEIGAYVMSLKSYGVDVYTVKEGLISPETDDILGQIVLALRYGNAQKSSSDTGMRVKDTAKKMVRQGKFMGGKAPYGYKLQLSGEISKHGRALHKLVIDSDREPVVKYIYELSCHKEYGSFKIAKILNEHPKYNSLAPNDVWKSGTITSILTNPIYAGHVAYKRRERKNGKYHRLDDENWIKSEEVDPNIMMIDEKLWNKVQERRKFRRDRYVRSVEKRHLNVVKRNTGELALIDVIFCGYCGCKLTNGTKYNYWIVKGTGEKKCSKIPIYKCQQAWQGVQHEKTNQYRADKIEPIVFDEIASYIGRIQEEDIFEQMEDNQNKERKRRKNELKKEQAKLDNIKKKLEIMELQIPDAIIGKGPFSVERLVGVIDKYHIMERQQKEILDIKEEELQNTTVSLSAFETLKAQISTWQDIFLKSNTDTKRIIINKLIERIDVKKDEIKIRFRINLKGFIR